MVYNGLVYLSVTSTVTSFDNHLNDAALIKAGGLFGRIADGSPSAQSKFSIQSLSLNQAARDMLYHALFFSTKHANLRKFMLSDEAFKLHKQPMFRWSGPCTAKPEFFDETKFAGGDVQISKEDPLYEKMSLLCPNFHVFKGEDQWITIDNSYHRVLDFSAPNIYVHGGYSASIQRVLQTTMQTYFYAQTK